MMDTERPIFIKVEKYEDIVNAVEVIRKKINEAKSTLAKINDMKTTEESELDKWSRDLTDVESKIDVIEGMLSEGM